MNMKNKLSDQLLEFLATGFYSGLVPYAPGTLASLLASIVVLPLIYISLNPFLYIIFLFLSFNFGLFLYKKTMGKEKDAKRFVWDEFVGIWISFFPLMFFMGNLFLWSVSTFLIFRFFDIVKPGFIGRIDKRDEVWAVMLDDALSGLLTALMITIIYLLV